MSAPASPSRQPIAIIGMSGRFPGARSLEAFWQNLREGVDALETFSDEQMSAAGVSETIRSRPGWVNRGTVLEDVDLFDAAFFGYSPREAQIIDPQQRLFLECAWEALEHAGYAWEPAGTTIGVYAGASINTYFLNHILSDRALAVAVGGYQLMLGNDKDFLCTRVSYKLDLHGPSVTIQTACSTSLVAVQVACRALQRGECDMALAGGVSLSFPQRTGYPYEEGMIFSPDGTCRPFDADGRGTRVGAGAGIAVLKRLADAIADRDTIHAVILGAAVNNDGAGKAGYTAPSVDGQLEVIATAQALAGIPPRSVSYIEAHGTATPLGDPIEIAALTRAFRASTEDIQFCALGSLKANLGHLDAAAGIAGLIKAVLALEHRELPPLPHFRTPNPLLDLPTSPFRVPTVVEPWATNGMPRRAGVSSFGIGGTNAHVVIEEAPAVAESVTHRAHQLLVLSARTPEALDAATARLVEHLRARPTVSIADVAYTLQVGRRVFPHRRAVVVRDVAGTVGLLSRVDRETDATGTHEGAARPVAFLFSGQGSQHAGMCRALYGEETVFRAAFDRCAEYLTGDLGRDLRELLHSGTEAEVSETEFAQPLLFVTGYALAMVWMSWGVQPAAMLGHSIGEYVAAHLAGVLSLEDALTLVTARGRLMQALAPGGMMAVSLSASELQALLRDGVEIAAMNAPALCTVSGTHDAVAALAHDLEAAGIEHRMLHTSHAFHSAMMTPALAPFREIVGRLTLSPPRRPYVSNVTGTWIRPEEATSPDYYVSHLRSAVRFAEGVTALAVDTSTLFLEVGPGTALSALARQTLGRDAMARVISSMPHPREKRSEGDALLTAAARLWTSGVAIDWTGMHRDEQLSRVPLPSYPFERKRHWVDASQTQESSESRENPYRREDLKDWFHVPTWARAPIPATRRRRIAGLWLVVGGDDALTAETSSRLRTSGAEVFIAREGGSFASNGADQFIVRADVDDDYAALVRTLRNRDQPLAGIVHLWNAGAPASPIGDEAVRPFHAITALARALILEDPSSAARLIIATSEGQSVVGEAVTAPARALVAGPVLALPAEHETLWVAAVDLDAERPGDWAATAAAQLVDEAAADDGEPFVAWRSGTRWVKRYSELSLPAADRAGLPLKERGVYLITGGTGGIGITLAEWLATQVSARLVLTSRTPFPHRDTWDDWIATHAADEATALNIGRLRAVEAAGGEVLVMAADAADEPAMRRVVGAVLARWGGIDGVVHSAGVAGGGSVAFSTGAEDSKVLSAKMHGTHVLTRILGETPLDFFVVFSSISAVLGSPGVCAYGAACAYLDAFVLSSRRPASWRHVASMAWDAWRDLGMAERVVVPLARRSARQAFVAAGIRPASGAETFGRALASGLPQLVVSPYEVNRVLAAIRGAGLARTTNRATPSADPVAVEQARPAPSADGFEAPEGEIEKALAVVWESLLGVRPIGVHENFFELGGHSLIATRILARVAEQFGIRLPLRSVFEAPTIRELAGVLVTHDRLRASVAAVDAAGGDREEFEL